MKKIHVNILDYTEFNELIFKNYGVKFDYLVVTESGNDTDKLYHVVKEELDEYDIEHMFISPQRLLTDMVNRGILEEGYYLVEVSW